MATDAGLNKLKNEQEIDTAAFNEYMEWFDFLDKDGNGMLDQEEFKKALYAMGWHPSDQEVDDVWKVADIDGNGFVDKDEYEKLLKKLKKDPNEEKAILREAFRKLDKSKNHEMTRAQMKNCLRRLGCWMGDLSGDDMEKLLDEADKNKDGMIDIDEFVDVMLKKP